MTISRENKTLILSELKDKLKNSECILLAHYSGVNVQDLEYFRELSRNSGVEVKVIKNSLFSAGHVVVPDYLPNSVSNYPIEVASKQSKKR